MHELLAPLIFILHCDHQAFLHACEIESVRNFDSYQRDLTKHLLDPRYLEHDAYSLFYQIMETVEPWYVSKEIIPDIQRPGVLCSKPFTRPADIHPSNVIVTKLTRIQDYLLKRFDIELHERLQSMDIVPQIYGIRWVRLLFGREFPMQDLLMLWDAIFADGISFDLVDYVFVAMLLYIRDAMLTSDYASCLHLLMKYPPIADIQYFIDKALYLREPNELPRPPEYQYQKPAQFGGINGWTASSMLTAGRMTNRATGSLGSSISRGLSTLQRPGSLVIAGSTQISKSTSEPMNLITDTAVSPQSAPGDFQDDPFARKLSTASLSHIELALNQSRAPGTASTGLRTNTSTQSLIQVDGWRTSDDQTVVVTTATTGESVISPPTSSRTGSSKFFMFGGTRSARKSASKQKQQKNGMDADGSRPMTSVIVGSDSLCRRCATELDIHIGTLQRHLLKQDHHGDDEVLLALAGIKQVRDVLKGVLKPSCLLDCAETESVPGTSSAGWYSNTVSASGVRRQHSEGSAQSSLSTTPVHDVSARNRFYIATPDLLSSDTDVTSPENLFLGAAAGIGIMGRNDGVALVGGVRDSDQLTAALELSGNVLDCEVVDDCSGDGSRGRRSSEVTAAALPYGYRGRQLEQPFSPSHTCGYMSGDNGYPNTPDGCRQDRKLHLVTCHAGTADAEGVTEMVNSGSKSVDVPQQTTTVSGGRLRVNNEPIAAPTHKQGATGPRDSSPINRLAGLFRNFPKF
jgi:TBC1 domain family protein 5